MSEPVNIRQIAPGTKIMLVDGALAEVVSPAVYVEPALLRMARYRLVPRAGAEAEADLWLGPLATPTRRGLVFTAPVLSALRTRLAADPDAQANVAFVRQARAVLAERRSFLRKV